MKHSFTLIHWYGPFELSEVIESDWGKESGLYLFTGKQKMRLRAKFNTAVFRNSPMHPDLKLIINTGKLIVSERFG